MTFGISDVVLRKAMPEDLQDIKSLADAHRHELGFVHRGALQRSIEKEEVIVAVISMKLVGFVEYHHRKDEQTTIYHIAVKPEFRNRGVGRSLIDFVIDESRRFEKNFIRIKCPVDLEANRFYDRVGCDLVQKEEGRKRELSIWEISLNESC